MADHDRSWFQFRQIIPQPPGQWVITGPFETYESANGNRDQCKNQFDAQVNIVFSALSREAAEGMIAYQ